MQLRFRENYRTCFSGFEKIADMFKALPVRSLSQTTGSRTLHLCMGLLKRPSDTRGKRAALVMSYRTSKGLTMTNSAILPFLEMPHRATRGAGGRPTQLRALDLLSDDDLLWEGVRQFFAPSAHFLSVLAQIDNTLADADF